MNIMHITPGNYLQAVNEIARLARAVWDFEEIRVDVRLGLSAFVYCEARPACRIECQGPDAARDLVDSLRCAALLRFVEIPGLEEL